MEAENQTFPAYHVDEPEQQESLGCRLTDERPLSAIPNMLPMTPSLNGRIIILKATLLVSSISPKEWLELLALSGGQRSNQLYRKF
jgi:hypothetical protein